MTFSASDLYSALSASPCRKPVRDPSRCNLEPFKPETPGITPYLVLAQGRLTLPVVCLGPAHFRFPVRPPKFPSRPTRANPGRPCGGGLGGGPCQTPGWRRLVSTTCGSSMRAITQMVFWHTAQRSGSTCHTRRIRSPAGGWAPRGRAVYRIDGLRPPDSAFFLLPFALVVRVYSPRRACTPAEDRGCFLPRRRFDEPIYGLTRFRGCASLRLPRCRNRGRLRREACGWASRWRIPPAASRATCAGSAAGGTQFRSGAERNGGSRSPVASRENDTVELSQLLIRCLTAE
jgi:hypothetical protein